MPTLHLRAEPEAPACPDLEMAAGILRSGGTVAFATETVYGLGANALDPGAVAKIFLAKQRPSWDPLIVHIADESMLPQLAPTLPPAALALASRFWPGPLTLLVPRGPHVPDIVTAGRANVGIRMPAHPVARALIHSAGVPIAAPSANTFGHVSPTTAAHVVADLEGRIDAILDSGQTRHGLESTVVDASETNCILYRPGAVTLEQLRAVWPSVEPFVERPPGTGADDDLDLDAGTATGLQALLSGTAPEHTALPSPGIGMRHYAPRARLLLVESASAETCASVILHAIADARTNNRSVAVMLPEGLGLQAIEAKAAGAVAIYPWGTWGETEQLAHRLFAGLRDLDQQNVDVILCPLPAAEALGLAIIDRLRKAARPR